MPESQKLQINPWIIAVAVMLGTFMEVLDTTVVNVSLEHIAGSLSATIDEATWVLTSYLVANAIILPMTGWLANQFGRKRILTISIAGFTLASLACGLAPNLSLLIVFRVIQGATGGALQPISQAVLLEAFPPEKRGKAMGFWGLGIVVAPMLGPVFGGYITDNFSWRWVFYINLPVGILALIMCQLFIFDPSYIRRKAQSIDYWGIGLLALGIGALQIMLDKGQEEDWFGSDLIRTLAVIAAIGLAVFVVRELLSEHPVVDLRVFRIRNYSTGVFMMSILGLALYGSTVLIPIFLQTLLGYPALQAGWAMLPRGLGSFLAMPLVGALMSKVDARKLLFVGFLVAAYAMWNLSSINLNVGYWDIFWPQFIQGLSLGFIFVPLTTVTHDPIPKERMGNATSMFNLMRNLGGGVGISYVTTLNARHTQINTNIMGAHVNAFNQAAITTMQQIRTGLMAKGMDPSTATDQAYALVFGMVQRHASMAAFVGIFRLLGIMFLGLIPMILLMRRPQRQEETGAAMH